MWPNPQFPEDLVTFTEEILMENFTFLCSSSYSSGLNMERTPVFQG